MNKLFTFAFLAAFSSSVVEAQVLKYGAEAGETAPSTVNWYDSWKDAGGQIEFGNSDAATGSGAIYVNTPEEAGAAQDWERVLKFDGLKIKANTNYRVRFSAKAASNAVVGLALMCGDENCDMPFVLPTANGYYSQKKDVTGFNEVDYKTKAAIFRYTTDEYQQKIYPSVKADDPNPLGANRFLRLTVKSVGEYLIDDVIVEEAPIAACYNSTEAIKVDFGFPTNIAQLAKANAGVVSLDPSCAKLKVNGAEVEIEAVELKSDGYLYIFPAAEIEDGAAILVSFDATNSGIKYSGDQTPGDGLDVPSFTDEVSYADDDITEISSIWEDPKLVSSTPKDGSFELDEDTDEFSFTFDKDIFISGKNAPVAMLSGGNLKKGVELVLKETGAETGRTVTFTYNAKLPKGSYSVKVSGVQSSKEVDALGDIAIIFETGKVAVAEIEYTDIESIDIKGDNDGQPTNWNSYFNDEPATGGVRVFDFSAEGKYTKGYYLSQRDAENGTALTYGENPDAPLELPKGDVQLNILASAWQGNTGNFAYELLNAEGEVVKSGNGTAEIHQSDRGIIANDVSIIPIQIENCKPGTYVLRLSTKSGGYGNAIIVWGLDIKTYEVGQGETADNQLVVDGSFAGIVNDGAPNQGSGFTIYEIVNGEVVPIQKGAETGIGQRARVFTFANIPTMPAVYYNRNMGGNAETSYYMTYGETSEQAGEEALYLDEVRYNFSWYAANWKGTGNKYSFQIIDVEEGNEIVYSREDIIDVNVNGSRDAAIEPVKIDFAWTAPHYGQYMLKWFMEGESMVGNIKVEQMGSMAVFWHTQLNNAIKLAEDELASATGDQYAGATRDALEGAIKEAKTVTYHTGEEYTEAMKRLEQYVKDMAARRKALSDYDAALADLTSQTEGMKDTKYEKLDSYKKAVGYVEKYAEVAGYTIENDVLVPLVSDMQTLNTLNKNLMANNNGVVLLTDQVVRLANTYVKLDEIVNGDESMAIIDDMVLAATEETVTDDQKLAKALKTMVTAALYKAIDKGYNFEELEFPDEEPSEDNILIPSSLDLTGFIQNSVFYSVLPIDKPQPTTQEESNGSMPGWEFNAPNGYAADWGWGGWSGTNQPVGPVNIADSQAGTRWATDFEVYQILKDLPVGIYSMGGEVCDRSHVNSDNVLEDGAETLSYLYVKQAGKDELQKTFDISNIGQYYGNTETLIEDITVEPVEGGITGKVTLGAVCDVDGSFAAINNAKIKMSAKHPTFDYKAAAAKLEEEISTAIKTVESPANGTIVNSQYFDLNGRKVVNAKGVLIRIDTMSDGSQRSSKVLRR